MARFLFGRLEETEVRKPSKARLVFIMLFVLLLVLSATFITLYAIEKSKSSDSSSNKPESTKSPSAKRSQSETCSSPTCVAAAAGMLGPEHDVLLGDRNRRVIKNKT